MSFLIPQTYPSPPDIGISEVSSHDHLHVPTTRFSKRISSHPKSSVASNRQSDAQVQTSVKSNSHTVNHEEIMATVLRSMASVHPSDESFCGCLKPPNPAKSLDETLMITQPEDESQATKKTEKVFDPRLYQRTLNSMSIQSDELLHAEHLWKAAGEQKSQSLTCNTKSSRSPSVKDGFIKNRQFGRAIDWGMEKEFWLSYIPNRCRVKGFTSGHGGFWTSQRAPKDPQLFQEMETEIVTGNRIPPAERCARYECQLEWEVFHKSQLDKKSYERSHNRTKNTQLRRTLANYKHFTSALMSNLKEEQSKSRRIDVVAQNRWSKRPNHNKLDKLYKTYRTLQSVETLSESLPPILATQYLTTPQTHHWMNLLGKDDILELLTNSIANPPAPSAAAQSSESIPSADDHTIPGEPLSSCDYPELLTSGETSPDPPGIIWPRNISLLDIPSSSNGDSLTVPCCDQFE